jgi:hypothetical protein
MLQVQVKLLFKILQVRAKVVKSTAFANNYDIKSILLKITFTRT